MGRYTERKEYDYYRIYVKESVSGLQKDSPVKYMGVEIGRVHKIQIDPNNPEVVLITIQVPKGIPIRKGMWATLKKIGITGLSYIEISGGSKNAPLLKTAEGEIPTIPYKPSMFARLGLSVEDLSYQISNISKKVGEVLSEKNVKNFSDIMENLKVSTSVIRQQFFTPENAKNVEMLLKNLKRASARLDSVLVHVDAFVAANKNLPPKFELLMDRLDKAAKNAMEISTLIHKGVQRGDYNLRAITQGTLDTVNQLVDQMQDVVIRVNNILDVIENSPSDFLFKSSRPAPGPGEGVSQR
jgi:phospholipid/cholesterol/gamma-HCH transport system substrate-binding protein